MIHHYHQQEQYNKNVVFCYFYSFLDVLFLFCKPFTLATYTFIIDIMSFVNSSVGVSPLFLFIIVIFLPEYFSIRYSINS